MKPDHTPLQDPLRTETPGLGPAPLRHDIGQNISPDISGMRTQTWESHPRRRVRWPVWVAGFAVLGVVAAMMFDVKPDQWVSAHLDRPAPQSESVPLPLPSQPAPQAQTDVPPLPSVAQAPDTAGTAPANAEPTRSAPESAGGSAREGRRSTTVAQAALQPRAEPATAAPTATPPEPAPVPADPKPVPVDPATPSTGP